MEILELLKEPVFFIFSLALSLLISISANLLTPKFNKLLSNFSSSLKAKQSERRQEYVSKIISVALDHNKVVNIKLDVAYVLLKSLIMIVFSLFLFSISPYVETFEYFAIFVSLGLVSYAISLFNTAQTNYKVATLASLRADKMADLRACLNEQYRSHDEYHDCVDPEEEMYQEHLSKWDKENL
ncbi:hypothetical protein [Pseudoalteromonas xiamenensis]